jgi:hypothetical protein
LLLQKREIKVTNWIKEAKCDCASQTIQEKWCFRNSCTFLSPSVRMNGRRQLSLERNQYLNVQLECDIPSGLPANTELC